MNCPLWNEMRQSCSMALAINEFLNLPTQRKPIAQLTRKEQETLDLICQAYSNQQISDALHIPLQTVKNRVTIILRKLGAKNRVQAVTMMLASKPLYQK